MASFQKENAELRRENAALKKEVEELKRQLIGGSDNSWNAFKSLMPSARRSIVKKNKVREGKKEISELMEAAKEGDVHAVERLLESGVPVDSAADWEFCETALHVASKWGHTRCVELLLANRADIDKRDENGETALYKAAEWGREETCKALANRGARLDVAAKRTKMTPLMVAAKIGHTETALTLVREGASLKMMNGLGQDAIQCARNGGQETTAQAIEKAAEKRRKSKRIDPTAL